MGAPWGRVWSGAPSIPPTLSCRGRIVNDPNRAEKLAWPSLLITRGHVLVHHIVFEADEEYRSERAPFTGATARLLVRYTDTLGDGTGEVAPTVGGCMTGGTDAE